MHLSLMSVLLLSVAAPAAAFQPTPDDPQPQLEREAPPPRAERVARDEPEYRARSVDARPQRAERFEPREVRPDPVRQIREPRPDPVRDVAEAGLSPSRGDDRRRPPEGIDRSRPEPTAGTSGWRERGERRGGRDRVVPPSSPSPVFGSAIPSPGAGQDRGEARELRDRIAAEGVRRDRVENPQWRHDWRKDRRYDWRRYRDRDRTRFHIGIYIDPFGYQYRNWQLGWRVPARYYATRYWINDPSYYRLPPVGGPYRWIRYHDDVLLIDLRTGRVLDVIRDFFW